MGKCIKCGNALGIFSAKHLLKDGFVCPGCFKEIEIENNKIEVENIKIMKDYIKNYLSNNAGLRFAIRNMCESLTSLVESHSLEKIKTILRQYQVNLESNKEGMGIDALMSSKNMNENSLHFVDDLEKLSKIFQNKGIDADYLKILSLFLECINEECNEAAEAISEKVYEAIVNLSGENLSQEEVVMLARQMLTKDNCSLGSIVEIILRLFNKFKLQGNEEQIKNLIKKIEEDNELSDFEENLCSQREAYASDFRELNGREFEIYLKKLFETLDYTVMRTKLSGDQGADLVLSKDNERIVVQIKKYNSDVSNKAIQEVVAAKSYYNADKALVVTNSFFTKGAVDLALANKVELWDGKKLDSVVNDLNKTNEKGPKEGLNYAQEGVQLVDEGKYDEAIFKFNKALKLFPNFVVPYCYRGLAYLKKGEIDKAIADSSKAIEIDSKVVLSFLVRGDAFNAKGEYEKAELDFTAGIEKSNDIQEAHQFYAKRAGIYLIQGENDKAIEDFNKAIEVKPDWAEVYYNRALCYYVREEYDKAWEDVHKAEELGYSGNPKLIENLQKASGREK